jgi:H+/Cl- antiporter ClcA
MQDDPYRATEVPLEQRQPPIRLRTRLYRALAVLWTFGLGLVGGFSGVLVSEGLLHSRESAFGWILNPLLGGIGFTAFAIVAISVLRAAGMDYEFLLRTTWRDPKA